MNETVLIDGHAHWHDNLDPVDFLDCARLHFRKYGELQSSAKTLQAILCLADFVGAEGWNRLHNLGAQASIGAWQLTANDELAMLATHEGGDRLLLVAGRQVVTAEKIEIIALGTSETVAAGLSLKESLTLVKNLGALPVLPWGAGKWWGRRGRLVKDILQHSPLLLGDNGGRPWFWKPSLLSRARRLGVPILPGSDPLPIVKDQHRNGAFGVVVRGPLPEVDTITWLKERLMTLPTNHSVFGGTLGLVPFVSNQLTLYNKGVTH